jgi:hypothetical protein
MNTLNVRHRRPDGKMTDKVAALTSHLAWCDDDNP